MIKELTNSQVDEILILLKNRFEKNKHRLQSIEWATVQTKLKGNPQKLWVLNQMEITGGEPALIGYDVDSNKYLFYDCSAESPLGRRSLCYDRKALDSRKENKPKNNAIDMAAEMGIEILTENQYSALQEMGKFDTKTSSWVHTPAEIRNLGGAIFCDFRYNKVFVYHNGAESYYAARGFRGCLRV